MREELKKEIWRKSIHLSSLIYPALYFFLFTKEQMLVLTSALLGLLLLFDLTRKFYLPFNNLSQRLLGVFLRSFEKEKFTGATHFMFGTFIAILLFQKDIAIAALLVLIISDTCAAIFGMLFGVRKIYQEKTYAGFFAFFVSAALISSFFNLLFVIAAFTTALIELYSKKFKIDDNITIPLSYGLVSSLVLSLS